MKLYAYAKINLSLYVIGLKDGMHLLDSIMLTCKDIKDTIIIKKSSIDSLKFSGCQTDKIDVNNNTVKKALGLFRKNTGIYTPLDIKVIKKIPIMAGLGGSSADAACLLRGLAKMFGLNIQNSSIQNAAKNTGSDVAYMLDRRAARVSGVGECVEYIDNNTKLYMLIAMDECISTKECFAVFDNLKLNFSDKVQNDMLEKALKDNNYSKVLKFIHNDLYTPAKIINPKIINTEVLLKKTNSDIVSMTGSGGAFFALTSKKSVLKDIYKSIKGKTKYIFKTDIF